ncbi:MAG TPA: ASCH domain-containing protein [Tepidisphaeraceae bacterium]|jgi:hypothetical protein|nr:ASCH domain-containing protein [Tepidisphaeraceae bacterium]
MKAISLWQPWASLIAIGAKCYETRSWSTSFRGRLAIHASKTNGMLSAAGEIACADAFKKAGLPLHLRLIPHGAIVCVCRLERCLPTHAKNGWTEGQGNAILVDGRDFIHVSAPQRLFGDYAPGRFAWKLTEIEALQQPIPFRGRQGLFDVPDTLIKEAMADHPVESVPIGDSGLFSQYP